jgi:hypothetical protein
MSDKEVFERFFEKIEFFELELDYMALIFD